MNKTIKIVPAILSYKMSEFKDVLSTYIQAGVKELDIDLVDETFGTPTISLDQYLLILQELNFQGVVNWDLMIEEKEQIIEELILEGIYNSFVIHGEIDPVWLNEKLELGYKIIPAIEKSQVADIDLNQLSNFEAIQVMTIIPGTQGAAFLPEMLDFIKSLPELGYKGRVGIDGGINLETIRKVLKVCNIDRVSVGSYFQNKPEDFKSKMDNLLEVINA